MQHDGEVDYRQNQTFAKYVKGTARIPNSEHWHLTGFRASHSYLFPGRTMDDTYDQLLSPEVTDLVEKIEREKGVVPGALGRVAVYVEPTGQSAV